MRASGLGWLVLLMAAGSFSVGLLWQAMALPGATPGGWPLHFYQHVLGHLDGRDCPSYPVCSVYARQAFDRHGLLLGGMLVIDRLIHEAEDIHRGPWIMVEGETRLYDPLARNDFWLKGED
ncbi:MAG: membrane protein insertion efficiency factor YidD [Mariprofundaceae bacterium]